MLKTVLILSTLSLSLYAVSNLDVAKKSFDVISGYKSSISTTTMILRNAKGVENIRKLEIKKLESDDGDKSLLTFLYPNDIKNTKLLSFEVIGGDDKQWLYLPAIKRVKRISARNKSGSFMASEFSYEDISSQNYKNYSYSGEAEEVELEGVKYYKVTRVPKDKNSGYSKQTVYVDANTFLAKSGEYYDKQNRLLKEVVFSNYEKMNGIYRVHKIEIKNVQNKKSSSLTWDKDTIQADISAKGFSKRELKR